MKQPLKVKKYCNLFLLLFFLLFLGNTAKCANADKVSHALHIKTYCPPHHTLPKASMQKKKPARGYTTILFRLGIEGKGILIPLQTALYPSFACSISTEFVTNDSHAKYYLSFPDFLALSPQFLFSLSPHAPPVLC